MKSSDELVGEIPVKYVQVVGFAELSNYNISCLNSINTCLHEWFYSCSKLNKSEQCYRNTLVTIRHPPHPRQSLNSAARTPTFSKADGQAGDHQSPNSLINSRLTHRKRRRRVQEGRPRRQHEGFPPPQDHLANPLQSSLSAGPHKIDLRRDDIHLVRLRRRNGYNHRQLQQP